MRRVGPGPPLLSRDPLRRRTDGDYVMWPTGPYPQRPAGLTPAVDGTGRSPRRCCHPWTATPLRPRPSRRSGRSGSAWIGPTATRRSSVSSAARPTTRRSASAQHAAFRSSRAPTRSLGSRWGAGSPPRAVDTRPLDRVLRFAADPRSVLERAFDEAYRPVEILPVTARHWVAFRSRFPITER